MSTEQDELVIAFTPQQILAFAALVIVLVIVWRVRGRGPGTGAA